MKILWWDCEWIVLGWRKAKRREINAMSRSSHAFGSPILFVPDWHFDEVLALFHSAVFSCPCHGNHILQNLSNRTAACERHTVHSAHASTHWR